MTGAEGEGMDLNNNDCHREMCSKDKAETWVRGQGQGKGQVQGLDQGLDYDQGQGQA